MTCLICAASGLLIGINAFNEINGFGISLYFILLIGLLLPSAFPQTKVTIKGEINFQEHLEFVLANKSTLFTLNFFILLSGFAVILIQCLMINIKSHNYFYGVGIWVGILFVITSVFSTITSNYYKPFNFFILSQNKLF
jgi:hypothetical protein